MKKSRYTEEQTAFALKQAETGAHETFPHAMERLWEEESDSDALGVSTLGIKGAAWINGAGAKTACVGPRPVRD